MSMARTLIKRVIVTVLSCAGVSVSWQVVAEVASAGEITLVTGNAKVWSAGGKSRFIKTGSLIYEGDSVETQKNSRVKIKYSDGSIMLLRPQTKWLVEKYNYSNVAESISENRLLKGGLRVVTGKIAKLNKRKYIIETSVATLGVRGTDITIRLCQDDCNDQQAYAAPAPENGLYTGVNKGGITLTNESGSRGYNVGQFGYVAGIKSKPVLLPSVPAMFVIDNLPDPTTSNIEDYKKGKICN